LCSIFAIGDFGRFYFDHQREGRILVAVEDKIVGNHFVGPYVLTYRLNVDGYLRLLNEVLPDLIEEIPLAIQQKIWYLHDSAPFKTSLWIFVKTEAF
jgi:hypothetical protein